MNQGLIDKLNRIISETDTNFSPYYPTFPEVINELNLKRGLETGTFCMGNVKSILENTDLEMMFGVDQYAMYEQSHMLDINSQEEWDMLYKMAISRIDSNRYIHYRMKSTEAFHLFEGVELDFVFLDSLHTYDNLKWELENYGSLVRTGGIIFCHDYAHGSFPDLTIAIDEYVKDHDAQLVICPLHLVYMIKTW
jgi:hypothetical protein